MANHEPSATPAVARSATSATTSTSSPAAATNIHAVLSRLTGFRNSNPGALDQHLRRHNRHDLTARLPGLHPLNHRNTINPTGEKS